MVSQKLSGVISREKHECFPVQKNDLSCAAKSIIPMGLIYFAAQQPRGRCLTGGE